MRGSSGSVMYASQSMHVIDSLTTNQSLACKTGNLARGVPGLVAISRLREFALHSTHSHTCAHVQSIVFWLHKNIIYWWYTDYRHKEDRIRSRSCIIFNVVRYSCSVVLVKNI